ncbi:geranylgeranyl reductase family protein, partial [Chloroflexota bacterium]
GATLGYELARRGVGVLILDKARLPRYKACAGGITVRTARLLDFDVESVAQRVVYGVRVVYKGKKEFTRWYDKPLIYTVMRDEFDYFLVKRAEEAGAVMAGEEKVCRVVASGSGVEVETSDGVFRADIVAGADGASGVVASSLGLARGIQLGMGMETEVSVPHEELAKWDSLMGLDLGNVRGGYGWVFPKKDHLSVGMGCPMRQVRKLKRSYQKVLSSHQLEECETTRLRSHLLPVARKGVAIQSDRGLLLGDAAGLLDPLTGEGIYYAIRSAQIAAPIIGQSLQDRTVDLGGYQRAVDREIMSELKSARALARVFTWFPGLFFNGVEGSNSLWNASCRLLRGEESYISLKRKLGVFQFAFDLLSR